MENSEIARNLVNGDGCSMKLAWGNRSMPSVHVPPGIPFFLAIFYWLELPNPHLAFQLVQVAASLVTLLCIWSLAKSAFSEKAAWVASLLYVLDVNLSQTVTWINETALNTLFVYLGLWLLLRLDKHLKPLTAALTGLSFALGALVRPTVMIIMAISLLWVVLRHFRTEWKKTVAISCCLVTMVVLVLAPWTIRNYRLTGKFIPITNNWAVNLWLSYNPRAAGSQWDADGNPIRPTGRMGEQILLAESEIEMDQYFEKEAWRYLREHPVDALKLRPLCFFYFWLDHNYWIRNPPFETRFVFKLANIILVGMFFLSVIFHFRRSGAARLFLFLILGISGFYTCFHADIGHQYRLQIEPIMLMFIAHMFVTWKHSPDTPLIAMDTNP